MFKKVLIFSMFALAFSCTDDTAVDVAEFTDQALTEVSLETRSGPTGCFELVFPISFEMPDASVIEVDSFEEAKEAFADWKENNPDLLGKPHLVFPLELVNSDAELITVDSKNELRRIRIECKKEFIQHNGRRCFKVVYPVSVSYPDETTEDFDSRREVKKALRSWKIENPDSDERPVLVFPIDVELLADGSIVTVNSKEELKQLKEDCR